MDRSDRTLIEAYLNGDTTAFEAIISRYGPIVYGYLIKMTKDRDKTDDIFQETFQKACEKIRDFRGDLLKPWILAIAVNTTINYIRKDKQNRALPLFSNTCPDGSHCSPGSNLVSTTQDDPAGIAELEEKRQSVRNALMRLSEQQRTTLVLSYYDKMTYREIAEILDCSIGTVKTNMFRALKRLAGLLPDAGGVK